MFDFCYLYSGVACPPGGAPHIRQRLYWVADAECAEPGMRVARVEGCEGNRTRNTEIGLSQNPHLEGASDVSRDR